jgi:hypothetical protein
MSKSKRPGQQRLLIYLPDELFFRFQKIVEKNVGKGKMSFVLRSLVENYVRAKEQGVEVEDIESHEKARKLVKGVLKQLAAEVDQVFGKKECDRKKN